MKSLALGVLLVTGCVTAGLNGARPGGGGALLGEHVAVIRDDPDHVGVIAKDLSGSASDIHADTDPSRAVASNSLIGAVTNALGFAGATSDSLCLLHRVVLAMDDATPIEKLQKSVEDDLAASPLWLEAVDSLDQVATQAPWPLPLGGVNLTTVKVLGDEQLSTVKKKSMGNGDYVDVKHDSRIVSFALCGPRPATTPSSRFLIGLTHVEPAEGMTVEPKQFDDEQNRRSRMSKDAMFVWALTDDGKYDLGGAK